MTWSDIEKRIQFQMDHLSVTVRVKGSVEKLNEINASIADDMKPQDILKCYMDSGLPRTHELVVNTTSGRATSREWHKNGQQRNRIHFITNDQGELEKQDCASGEPAEIHWFDDGQISNVHHVVNGRSWGEGYHKNSALRLRVNQLAVYVRTGSNSRSETYTPHDNQKTGAAAREEWYEDGQPKHISHQFNGHPCLGKDGSPATTMWDLNGNKYVSGFDAPKPILQ